ncbi:MAG: superinfection immunity protein [Propionibacteriaceae bacterium]
MSYVPYQQQVVPARPQCSTAHIVIAWILAFGTLLYLLPWAIAATRSKSNVGVIAVLNIFLGWTAIGWIVSLVMACLSDTPQVIVVNNSYPQAPPGPYGHGQVPPPPYGFNQPMLPPGARQSPPPVAPIGYGGPPQHAFGMSSMHGSDTYPEITQEIPIDPYLETFDPYAEDDKEQ